MDLRNASSDFRSKLTGSTRDGSNRAAVDGLGGETLEGSGFENETPDPEFQFNRTLLEHPSEGGLQ
jgi:hypothetical protein